MNYAHMTFPTVGMTLPTMGSATVDTTRAFVSAYNAFIASFDASLKFSEKLPVIREDHLPLPLNDLIGIIFTKMNNLQYEYPRTAFDPTVYNPLGQANPNASVPQVSVFEKYASNFDILFSGEQMRKLLMGAFCHSATNNTEFAPNILKFAYPLLRFCDVNYVDPANVPLFVHICKHCQQSVIDQYISKYDFSLTVDTNYNIISYLINELSHRNSPNMRHVLYNILEYVEKSKSSGEIAKLFTVFPEDWECLLTPLFDVPTDTAKYPFIEQIIPSRYDQFVLDRPMLGINSINSPAHRNSSLDIRDVNVQSAVLQDEHQSAIVRSARRRLAMAGVSVTGCVVPNAGTSTSETEVTISQIIMKFHAMHYTFDNVFDIVFSFYKKNNLALFKCFIDNKLIELNAQNIFGYTLFSNIIKDMADNSDVVTGKEFVTYLMSCQGIDIGLPNILNQTAVLIATKCLLAIKQQADRDNASVAQQTYLVNKDAHEPSSTCNIGGFDCGCQSFAPYPACFGEDTEAKPVAVVKQTTPTDDVRATIMKMLAHPTCNPNIADVNNDCPLFVALQTNDIQLITGIIKSANFNANHKYNDGSRPIIKIVNALIETETFDKTSEIYFYVLNLLLNDKNVSLTVNDLRNMNALMYASQKDDNVVFKKLLECDIPISDLNALLNYVSSHDLTVNTNLVKMKIASCTSKQPSGKRYFFF